RRMPEVGSQNTTSAGYFHFLFGNLNPGGNESMTKQRIGVLVVSALLAVASLAQAPPAKQKPAAKKSGGAVSGGPVMPGSEQWMDVPAAALVGTRSEEHTSELQSLAYLVCRLLLEKKTEEYPQACAV